MVADHDLIDPWRLAWYEMSLAMDKAMGDYGPIYDRWKRGNQVTPDDMEHLWDFWEQVAGASSVACSWWAAWFDRHAWYWNRVKDGDRSKNPWEMPVPPDEPPGLWDAAADAVRDSNPLLQAFAINTIMLLAWARTIRMVNAGMQ